MAGKKQLNKAAASSISLYNLLNNKLLTKKQREKIIASLNPTQINNLRLILHEMLYTDHGLNLNSKTKHYVNKNKSNLVRFADRNTKSKARINILKKTGGFLPLLGSLLPVVAKIAGPLVKAITS